jgi:hypothetical protein
VLTILDTDTLHTEQQEQRPEFHIDSEAAANWYARRMASIEAERTRVKAQAAAIVAQLDADENHLRRLYEDEAREWARQEIERRHKGRRRSLVLLQGTFAFRAVPPALKLADEAAALDYAERRAAFKGNPDGTGPADFPNCARLEPTLDAATYREAAAEWFEQTGELLPGCVYQGERETFAVRFGKDTDTSANGGKEAGE